MKTLRLIYMAVAAIFLVASCDDDSMNTDKVKVSTVFGNDKVEVVVTDTSYNLSWEPYTIYAGGRLAICTQYDVFVTPVYFDDTQKELYEPPHHWHLITTVDSCCAQVSKNSVDTIFDDNSYFAFCVFPSGIDLYYASDNNFILSQTLNSSGRESVLIGASADPNRGHVEVSGEGEENMRKIGETVKLTAIAYEGYKFVQWSDGNTDNPRKLLVTEEVYLEALFEETVHLYRVYVYAVDEYENSFDARQLIEINSDYVPLEDDNVVYQVAGAYEYGQTALITVKDGNGYVFKSWSNGSTDKTLKFDVYEDVDLVAYFEKQNLLENSYSDSNLWFLAGDNEPTGRIEDGNYIINVAGAIWWDERGIATVWNDNFEVVFHRLENQFAGNEFLMEFDITWNGDNETADFRICSGVDNFIEGIPTYNTLTEEQVWDQDYNTELIFDDFSIRMGETFTVGSEGRHVQWGGTIGQRGEDYIGIEINLSGTEKDGVIYENGPGTFTISNMQVFMGGKKVWPKSE